MLTVLQLYWSFMKIGMTSFGGLSMVPLINSEMGAHGWMTVSEIADIIAIAEITPGPLGLNCATFAGMRVAGILGALAANFGMLTPTLTIGVAAAFFFEKFKKGSFLKSLMVGVRPAGIGLIYATMLNLSHTNYLAPGAMLFGYTLRFDTIAIGLVGLYLLLVCKWSIPKTIGAAALLGILTGVIWG